MFWTGFFTSLKDCGLAGLELVISNAHRGLQAFISKTLQGSASQRCRVHLLRNVLAHVARGHAEMVAALVRTVFAQPILTLHPGSSVRSPPGSNVPCTKPTPCSQTRRTTCPPMPISLGQHRRKIWTTNPLERVNTDIKRRTNDDAVLRLVGAILAEQHNEWPTSDRHYLTLKNVAVHHLEQLTRLALEAA